MLYVVSGFMRTGTSMMMKALEAGGINTSYKQSRDEMKDRYGDDHYDPNIGGLYELERNDYRKPDFPRPYDGKLIKGLNGCIPNMNVMPNGISVVFMRRDPEEIRQSYDAFFSKQLSSVETLNERMETIIERIKNRKDVVSFTELWYRNVVDNPYFHFSILKNEGWDIDVNSAAKVVDPNYCRFKKEELTIGVI